MPTPIDPNTEILRVNMAERIQQLADRASLLGQVRQSINEEERRVIEETQVKEAEQKSEQVDTELKRRQPFLKRRKKRPKSIIENSEGETDSGRSYKDDEGGHLDIRI
ncbi:MAG: hypothetical protein N3G21_11500 [Candidatus Hydrogenedentes bacterium]|nr:hypothetical protein [Candidatus Hydrogenedentota bacterium]